jgi:glycosyltransferase involved in cell wall biosynthesis
MELTPMTLSNASQSDLNEPVHLSVIIPCFNEEKSLQPCVKRVFEIEDQYLSLEVIIVDDGSSDKSLIVAKELKQEYKNIHILSHERNKGKGAALRTGFQAATGNFIAIQDADLEYNPKDLRRLLEPLVEGKADVVIGSRFLSAGAHRVLYFWHYIGNRFLTLLSNMFTDLNLSDMETCYKVFTRDIIKQIDIKENRFGVEPEIIAKVAHLRPRIYEMGISYDGRTYAEGKKIGVKDGIRALYCILRYNAHKAPIPVQFLFYIFIGGTAAIVNLFLFLGMYNIGIDTEIAAPAAFFLAAIANYLLCIALLFKHKVRWNLSTEVAVYFVVVGAVAVVDLLVTHFFIKLNWSPAVAKSMATLISLVFNFAGRRFFVFPESTSGPWSAQADN